MFKKAAFEVPKPEAASVVSAEEEESEREIFFFAVCVLAEPFLKDTKP